MKRLRLKVFLWSVLLISVFLKNVEPSSVTKRGPSKATKATLKPQLSTTSTTVAPRSTTSKPSSRNTPRPKNSKRTTTTTTTTPSTTTTTPTTTTSVIDSVKKQNGNRTSTAPKRKQSNRQPTSTTTLSPIEVMNRLYQMHGLASHGIAACHSANTQSTALKKKEQQAGSSMDDIYRLHAMAMAQASSHSQKQGSSSSESSSSGKKPSDSLNTKQSSHSNYNSMENIYQQHSSLPSSMHHIMSQHSVSSSHSSGNSRPLKSASSSSSSSVQESSGSSNSLSTLMQPLLKQLTPVGAGIGVVLAPLLLFNGFLQFFSNMSRFLNNFAQTILPVRRPLDNNPQNQNAYFQNLGPAHLKRQPRDWYLNPYNMAKIQELTELFFKALKESEVH